MYESRVQAKYVLAYTPPPLALNPDPYVVAELARMPHPWFEVDPTEQSVPAITLPEIAKALELEEAIVHPSDVWSGHGCVRVGRCRQLRGQPPQEHAGCNRLPGSPVPSESREHLGFLRGPH